MLVVLIHLFVLDSSSVGSCPSMPRTRELFAPTGLIIEKVISLEQRGLILDPRRRSPLSVAYIAVIVGTIWAFPPPLISPNLLSSV